MFLGFEPAARNLEMEKRIRSVFAGSLGSALPDIRRQSRSEQSTLHLFECALLWLLVRTPAQELCAVAKAAAGEVIVLNFAHKLRRERLPFSRSLGCPTARPAGRIAGETRGLD